MKAAINNEMNEHGFIPKKFILKNQTVGQIYAEGPSLPISALDFWDTDRMKFKIYPVSLSSTVSCTLTLLLQTQRWMQHTWTSLERVGGVEKNSLLAATMFQAPLMLTSPSRYMLLCWVYLDIKTEVWGPVYIPQPGCDRARVWTHDHIRPSHTHPFHQPLFFREGRDSCLDRVLGEPLARQWDTQDLDASLAAWRASVLSMDISTLLGMRSGSYSWLAKKPLGQSCLCSPQDLLHGQSWKYWAARSGVSRG